MLRWLSSHPRITFVKTSGNSPLAPGQWQGFLAVYAGLWAMQNFIRPIRFTLALGERTTRSRTLANMHGCTLSEPARP